MKFNYKVIFLALTTSIISLSVSASDLSINILSNSQYKVDGNEVELSIVIKKIETLYAKNQQLKLSLSACDSNSDKVDFFANQVRKNSKLKGIAIVAILRSDCR